MRNYWRKHKHLEEIWRNRTEVFTYWQAVMLDLFCVTSETETKRNKCILYKRMGEGWGRTHKLREEESVWMGCPNLNSTSVKEKLALELSHLWAERWSRFAMALSLTLVKYFLCLKHLCPVCHVKSLEVITAILTKTEKKLSKLKINEF